MTDFNRQPPSGAPLGRRIMVPITFNAAVVPGAGAVTELDLIVAGSAIAQYIPRPDDAILAMLPNAHVNGGVLDPIPTGVVFPAGLAIVSCCVPAVGIATAVPLITTGAPPAGGLTVAGQVRLRFINSAGAAGAFTSNLLFAVFV